MPRPTSARKTEALPSGGLARPAGSLLRLRALAAARRNPRRKAEPSPKAKC
jgi:hypothetical protein